VKRRQESRLKKTARAAPQQPAAAAKGPIAPGDQVVLDGGSSSAEVLEVEGKEAVITAGAMRLRVRLDRLTKVGGPRRQQVVVRQPATVDLSALQAQHRVDLRGQRVEEALHLVQRMLDQALAANLDRVELLHGKGTGALRQAIHDYLATRSDVAGFEDAPWDEGGPGVTYVTLH
jgi:DNA mismatch repair protein MutS2